MLAPILPSPIMPSCIERSSERDGNRVRTSGQRLLDGLAEFCQIALDVFAEMNTQRAAPALGKHGKVAARLSSLHDAESVFLPGHGNVRGVIAGDLQEHTAVRATLVSL